MEKSSQIKGMMKWEYSQFANITPRTLRRYLNILYLEDLRQMDYRPTQRHLTPKQVHFLNEKLVVISDN